MTECERFKPSVCGCTSFYVRTPVCELHTVAIPGTLPCCVRVTAKTSSEVKRFVDNGAKVSEGCLKGWFDGKHGYEPLIQLFRSLQGNVVPHAYVVVPAMLEYMATLVEKDKKTSAPCDGFPCLQHPSDATGCPTVNADKTEHVVEPKETNVALADPIVDGMVFTPSKTEGTMRAAVKARVTDQQAKVANVPSNLPRWMFNKIPDFLKSIHCHKLEPYQLYEVEPRQTRPNQQRSLAFGMVAETAEVTLNSFMKMEPLAAENSVPAKIARVITPMSDGFKVEYSRYMYALSDHVKTLPWYAFGRELPLVAADLALNVSRCDHILETDYSKFDGTIARPIRKFEMLLLKAFFPGDKHVLKLHREQFKPGKVANCAGITYPVGTSRLSGSPETSVMNTLVNRFIAYCAGAEGMFGGDDGVVYDGDPGKLEKIATRVGLQLKCAVRHPGELYGFLGRRFMFSREPDPNSIQDLARCLPTLTMTTDLNAEKRERLVAKAMSWANSDANTPVVGQWARAVVNQLGRDGDAAEKWWWQEVFGLSQGWPNEYRSWFDDEFHRVYPGFDETSFNEFLSDVRRPHPAFFTAACP